MEEMSFKSFSIFSSGHHFVQPSGTILEILVEGHWRNTFVQILWNWAIGQGLDVVWRFSICSSGGLLVQWSGTIVAILEFQSTNSLFRSCCYKASFGSKRPKVWEEMSKIDFQDGGCGGYLGFSIASFSYFVSTRCPNAHHQVSNSTGLYRRCPKYKFSTFFRYKCIWPIQMHGEVNLILP